MAMQERSVVMSNYGLNVRPRHSRVKRSGNREQVKASLSMTQTERKVEADRQ
jgi:hypothetical protein